MSKVKIHYASYEAPHEGDNCEYWSDTACGQESENLTQHEDCVTCKNCLRLINASKVSYTRDQIKEAIRAELAEADHMGKDNSRYYEIVGVVMEGLDKIDKSTTTNDTKGND